MALSSTYIARIMRTGTAHQKLQLVRSGYVSIPTPNFSKLAADFLANPSPSTAAAITAPYEQARMNMQIFKGAISAHRSTSDKNAARRVFSQYQRALGITGATSEAIAAALHARPEYKAILSRPDFQQFVAQAHKSDPWLLVGLLVAGVAIGAVGFSLAAGAGQAATVTATTADLAPVADVAALAPDAAVLPAAAIPEAAAQVGATIGVPTVSVEGLAAGIGTAGKAASAVL
ncbi:MAG TPA: hypothetical protein VKA67_00960, partial [Verrucomicrobiae bacterium]|nr:hypothetical protein [Verrucomicrobiae bacterium]